MKKLRTNYHRWLNRNRNKGIPNLMLFVMLANVLIYVYCTLGNGAAVYNALCFDSAKILRGQVWRLVSFAFTYCFNYGGAAIDFFWLLVSAYFYWWVGKMLESIWGTLRLNIYYFGGILLTALFGLIVYLVFGFDIFVTPLYIHLSLFLAVATLAPEERVMVFFVIPVKMRWMALIYIGLSVYEVARYVVFYRLFAPMWVVLTTFAVPPLIPLLNYLLTFGKEVRNLFPRRLYTKQRPKRPKRPIITPTDKKQNASGARPYRHKCTVCGRTDADYPDLEFRYCSKCKGYYCYCIDHINNHTHIQ